MNNSHLSFSKEKLTRNILVLVFVLTTINAFSQRKGIDSLKSLLATRMSDTAEISLNLNLASKYLTINLDSFAFHSEKALRLSIKANEYRLSECYSLVGLSYHHRAKNDSARVFLKNALTILDKQDNPVLKSKVYNNYSLTYDQTDDVNKKMEYALKAIDLVKHIDEEVCILYYNLGVVYAHSGLIEKSIEHFNNAYNSSKRAKNQRALSASIYGLINQYRQLEKYEKAQSLLEEGIVLCSETQSPEFCYMMYNQKGLLLTNQKKYKEANKSLLKAQEFAMAQNDSYNIMISNITLALNESKRNNYNSSASYFEAFEKLYLQNPVPAVGISAYKDWGKVEFARKNYKKSYDLLNKYTVIRDSTFEKEKRQIIVDAEEKYETEKKEREIAEQQVQIKEQKLILAVKQKQVAWWSALGGLLTIGLGISFWVNKERQKRKQDQIESLERQQEIVRLEALVSGEEKERVRLAQDLHDGINGDLAVIKYKFDALDHKKFTKEETETHTEAIGMLDNAIDQVRRISHNLAPPSLHNFSLLEAIRQYCTKIQSAHPLVIDFQTFGKVPAFDNEKETAIYRIIQELLNNIVKHAEATEVLVQLNHTSEMFEVTVEDDGKGFDTKNAKKGIGLQNIASRVSFLKGKLDIDSSKKGTSFSIQIPNATIHNL